MVNVRFARRDDFARCVMSDGLVPESTVRCKIELNEIIVAEVEGDIVGYLRLEYLWSRIPYIGLVRVREDQRRRGIGRAMLQFLEGFLRGRGHRILLSSSQVNEPSAQAWHRAVGFQECRVIAGINRGGVGELFFRKPL